MTTVGAVGVVGLIGTGTSRVGVGRSGIWGTVGTRGFVGSVVCAGRSKSLVTFPVFVTTVEERFTVELDDELD